MVQQKELLIDDNTCPNCGIAVYQAEALLAGNFRWHKRCFKCCWCNKFLNTSNCNVHQGFLFCRHCLNEVTRNERPQTYADTTLIQAAETKSQGCPRCGGAVFQAEKVSEKGKTYHKKCFTCSKCNRPQDDMLQVFVGFDDQLYCRVCYPKITHTPLGADPRATNKIQAGPGDLSGCPRCGGKVFEAEKILLGNHAYHSRCFACRICSRPMDALNAVSHQNDIFCEPCIRTHYDTRSKSVGPPDTSVIRGRAGSRDTCPRCGGAVFEAEKVGARTHDFHKRCLSCNACSQKLDATTFFDAPDNDVYCRACYAVRFGHRVRAKSVGPASTKVIPGAAGSPACCPGCQGMVFEIEKRVSRGGWYHPSCFKCAKCNHLLDQTSFNDGPNDSIYCGGCYKTLSLIDVNQTAKSLIDTTAIPGNKGDKDACPKCGGKVFEAEKRTSRWGLYHKKCFTCDTCGRALDSLTAQDSYMKGIHCQSCYKKQYGPTEIRVLTSDERSVDTTIIKPSDMDRRSLACPRCGGSVFEAEKLMCNGFAYHKSCATCGHCRKKLDASSVGSLSSRDPEIYCQGCMTRLTGGAGYRGVLGGHWIDETTAAQLRPTQYINPAIIPASQGELACKKCHGKVFDLEKITSKHATYHKQCFSCDGCNKKLDSTLVYHYEAEDGGVNCKRCFVEKFGEGVKPMTYTDTSIITARDGTECLRCGGAVFEAEKAVANGRNFHRQCMKCRICSHLLDAASLNCGPNGDIYCAGCYGREIGGCGYRAGNHWVDEKSTSKLRPCQNVDTKSIKGVEGALDSCGRCNGKVYELEKITSKSAIWHKQCFSCKACEGSLTSSLVDGHEGPDREIYCKTCYLKSFGTSPRPQLYANTKVIKATSKDQSCPRCGGAVFEAEKVIAGDNVYFHKSCFECLQCYTKLDSMRAVVGKNGQAFCTSCHKQLVEAERAQSSVAKTRVMIAAEPGDPNACPRCAGKVFEAEKIMSRDRMFHKECFTCCTCFHKLDVSTAMAGPNSEIYCKTCYVREYFTGGRNKFGDISAPASALSTANELLEDSCRNCRNKVFEVDRVIVKSGLVHKHCLSCTDCRRTLDTSSVFDSGLGLFCNACYSDRFGVKGKGSTAPSSRVETNKLLAEDGDQSRCPRCAGKVFEAEMMRTSVGPYHPACFKCRNCRANLDQSSATTASDGEIYCTSCYKVHFGLARRARSRSRSRPASVIQAGQDSAVDETDANEDILAKAVVDTTAILAESGDKDGCPRCGGKVFSAEKMASSSATFHKKCFTCEDCHRALDPSLVCDGPGGKNIYCINCYKKKFGPSASRDFDASRAKKDLTAGTPLDPSRACGRCSGAVFVNEEVQASGKVYHNKCAKCKGCNRKLESATINIGEDKEIYCQGCASRSFGTAGYRGIQSMTWIDQDSLSQGQLMTVSSSNATSSTQLFRAEEGAVDACVRCSGKVFDAEKVISTSGWYHRQCFKCRLCQAILDTTKACESKKDIFCRPCYSKNTGIHGFGYGGFGSVPVLTAGGGEAKAEYHFTQFF